MQSRPIFNKSTRFEDMRNFDDERAPFRRPSGKKYVLSVGWIFFSYILLHITWTYWRTFSFIICIILPELCIILLLVTDQWIKLQGCTPGMMILIWLSFHSKLSWLIRLYPSQTYQKLDFTLIRQSNWLVSHVLCPSLWSSGAICFRFNFSMDNAGNQNLVSHPLGSMPRGLRPCH